MTAEFAASLPAVVLVLGLCLGSLQVGAAHVRTQDAVADAVRTVARGDTVARAEELADRAIPGAQLTFKEEDDLVCAELRRDVTIAGFIVLPVVAKACALPGGR